MEFMRNNFGSAESALLHALGISPDDSSTRYHLALVYLAQQHPQKAAREYDHILKTNPTDLKVLTERGVIELALGNRPAAREYFNRVLELEPSNEHARNYLLDLNQTFTSNERTTL